MTRNAAVSEPFRSLLNGISPHVPPALIAFKVEVTAGGRLVRSFEAMAESSCDVVAQHADLCEQGEKMSVMRLDLWQQMRREADRATAAEIARDPMHGYLNN